MAIPNEIKRIVADAAKGTYQVNLLLGRENWSGSSLRGAAKNWSSKYAASREALISRISKSLRGTGWAAETKLVLAGAPLRHRRELVLVDPTGSEHVW